MHYEGLGIPVQIWGKIPQAAWLVVQFLLQQNVVYKTKIDKQGKPHLHVGLYSVTTINCFYSKKRSHTNLSHFVFSAELSDIYETKGFLLVRCYSNGGK